jgi:trans-aconitate methyltransferase
MNPQAHERRARRRARRALIQLLTREELRRVLNGLDLDCEDRRSTGLMTRRLQRSRRASLDAIMAQLPMQHL